MSLQSSAQAMPSTCAHISVCTVTQCTCTHSGWPMDHCGGTKTLLCSSCGAPASVSLRLSTVLTKNSRAPAHLPCHAPWVLRALGEALSHPAFLPALGLRGLLHGRRWRGSGGPGTALGGRLPTPQCNRGSWPVGGDAASRCFPSGERGHCHHALWSTQSQDKCLLQHGLSLSIHPQTASCLLTLQQGAPLDDISQLLVTALKCFSTWILLACAGTAFPCPRSLSPP